MDSEGRRIWVERALTCGEGRLSRRHVRCVVICVVYGIDLGPTFHVQCFFLSVDVPRLEVSADDHLCRACVFHDRFRQWYHREMTSLVTLMVFQS